MNTNTLGTSKVTILALVAAAVLLSSSLSMGADTKKSSLSAKEVETLIVNAKTPAEHQRIADYYHQEAQQLSAKAKEHEKMAAEYAKKPALMESKQPLWGQAASHCRHFAQLYSDESKEAEALAALHEQMAKAASQK